MYEPLMTMRRPYELSLWSDPQIPEQWNSEITLAICLRGTLKAHVEGELFELAQESVLIIGVNEAHSITAETPKAQLLLLRMGVTLLGERFECLQGKAYSPRYFRFDQSEEIPGMLQPVKALADLARERTAEQRQWLVACCLYAIADHLAGSEAGIKSPRVSLQHRLHHQQRIQRAMEYVAANYMEQVSLKQVASVTGYDPTYFCKQFKKATGITFHSYLNRYRLRIACRYLRNSSMSMAEIAEECGFSSQKSMSRLFQNLMGITATQYRKLPDDKRRAVQQRLIISTFCAEKE